MADYVDAGCQTIWAGLTQRSVVRPDIHFTAPDTNTPPDDLITEKPQTLVEHPPGNGQSAHNKLTIHDRRTMHGPKLVTRIPLPHSKLDSDALLSPPPTHALLSPLPAANKLYAGHTPRMPLALSPGEVDDEKLVQLQVAEATQTTDEGTLEKDHLYTPEEDVGLKGPLSLPSLPTVFSDGADDHIALDALDEELTRIAREQERFSRLKDAPEPSKPSTIEEEVPLSRKTSSNHPYSTFDNDAPDGVILKSPRMNFGAPIGQAPRRRSEPSDNSPRF